MTLRRSNVRQTTPQQDYPRFGWLPPLKYVQVQTHSRCNADCVFCPYIESAHAAFHGRMTDETWKLIIQNLIPFKDGINEGKFCPYLMQEPLIDPSIFSKIEDIYTAFPLTCVEVSTNGAALSSNVIEKLKASFSGRSHELWVSHHGINPETLEHIMKIPYDKALQNVINLIRASEGKIKIRIRGAGESRIKSHTYFTRSEYLTYWDKVFAEYSLDRTNVEVEAFTFHDRAGTLHRTDRDANKLNMGTVRKIGPHNRFHCNRLNEWIHFMWDGQIRLCCMDYHGEVQLPNIHSMSLLDYYHGTTFKDLADKLTGRVKSEASFICKRCTSPGG